MTDEPTRIDAGVVERLSRRALLAFCARCALRVLPAYYPGKAGDATDAIARIKVAEICCLIAIHTSIDDRAQYAALGNDAADLLEGPSPPEMDGMKKCIQIAARVASSAASEQLPQISDIVANYRDIAVRLDAADEFERGATSDVRELQRLQAEGPESRTVDARFFGRPLFDTPAASWDSMIARWIRVLDTFKLPDVRDRYMRFYRGGEVLQASELSRAIEDWASGPRTRVQSPANQPSTSRPTASASLLADVWMLSDGPVDGKGRDTLRFKDYADAIATLLDHKKTGTPFTMAINAPWGAGKTSLSNMIVAELAQRRKDNGEPQHVICRFNAWMHDDATNVATAFVSEVSRTANQHRRWLYRIADPLPTPLLEPGARKRRRLGLLVVALAAVALGSGWIGSHLQHMEAAKSHEASSVVIRQTTDGVTLNADGKQTGRILTETASRSRELGPTSTPPAAADWMDRNLAWFESRMVVLGAFLTAVAGAIGIIAKLLTATPLAGFVQQHDKAVESGSIPAAGKQLKRLIHQATWRGNRFIVFVDDIERCKPPRAVDVLDAINQLMDHEHVMIVLLGDMAAVAAAAQLKYKDLAKIYVPNAGIAIAGADSGKEAFGRLYLQKIIQFQFDLPVAPLTAMRKYIEELAVDAPEGADHVRRGL